MKLRIGVDVGGTNTDAVLMDSADRVVATTKTPTTQDVVSGIRNAISQVVSSTPNGQVVAAMLGSTQCTNAVVQRVGLRRVAIVRLGAPSTAAVPPLADWPADLKAAVAGPVSMIAGGHNYTGRELLPLDEDAVRNAAHGACERNLPIAIIGVFSAVNPAHEERASAICHEVGGAEYSVSISSEIGSIGFLERENATVLNAALADIGRIATTSFQKAVKQLCGPDARCYFTQNDGTLMALDYARRYPCLMLASGSANSMRGAAYLSRANDALVLDVGGTTTDIGILVKGFPREAPFVVDVGGVRTNFRMPDVVSLPLGGGTIVYQSESGPKVGPTSVGHRLITESMSFGGTELTFTDVVLALGKAHFNVPVTNLQLTDGLAAEAYTQALEMINGGVERMRPSKEAIPAIGVGGGSVLLPDHLGGNLELHRPRDFAVANAIGAAISEVSGSADRIVDLGPGDVEVTRETVRAEARRNAEVAGADPDSIRIVLWEEVPIAYMPGNAIRLRAKAAGPLKGLV